jgi:hypothetical protein
LDCEPQPFDRLFDTQDRNYIFPMRREVGAVRIQNVLMEPVTTALRPPGFPG